MFNIMSHIGSWYAGELSHFPTLTGIILDDFSIPYHIMYMHALVSANEAAYGCISERRHLPLCKTSKTCLEDYPETEKM